MAQKMRAVRLFAPKDIRCVEVDVPHIEKDTQVLIKVKSCGVCGSDIPRVMVKGLKQHRFIEVFGKYSNCLSSVC